VTFEIAGRQVSATTGATGLASALVRVPDHGRSQQVTASFAGSARYMSSTTTATVRWGNSN
jgi:hypothetical protein